MNFKELHQLDVGEPKIPQNMRIWGAVTGEYQFVITFDGDINEYRASWKHRDYAHQKACHFDTPFQTFTAASIACTNAFRQLQHKN